MVSGEPKRLYRSNDQRIILGVCGGIGEYFDVDPTIVRIVLVIGTILTGFVTGIIIYAILAIIMPAEDKVHLHPKDAARSTVDEAVTGAKQAAGSASSWVNQQIKRSPGGSTASDAGGPDTIEVAPEQPAAADDPESAEQAGGTETVTPVDSSTSKPDQDEDDVIEKGTPGR